MNVATRHAARPVRVCFLIDELSRAGTETQLVALIRHLDRRRVTPSLCLLRGVDERSRALEPDGCPVLRLGVGSLRSPTTLVKAWRLARFLRRERIDVLQVYFPDSTYLGVPVAWLAGVPAIVRTRNNVGHWLTPLHRWLGRLLNGLTTATVANCDAAREALLQAERPRPDTVCVLENGVDVDRFAAIAPLSARPGPLDRVGVVANLRHVKGLDVLLDAAARLLRDHPGLTLRIAGDGPERESLVRQAAALGVEKAVTFLGSVTDVPAFLAEVDVAVLPSRAEGMSNAVLEYMAAGRAVVATNVGSNARLLDQGAHGLLVPSDDAGALADAVGLLLADRERACELGLAARRFVDAEFSRAAMVRRFEDFFIGLARRNRERQAA